MQYFSGDQIKKNEVGGACSSYVERRGVYRLLVGKPEGKRQLRRPRHRWKDNIKMYLQEAEWGLWTGSCCFRIRTGGAYL